MSLPEKTTVSAIVCKDYNLTLLEQKISDAIEQCGGLPDKIKPGAKILINPNLLTAKDPEHAATTHPYVVQALIRYLKKNGITDITVGDSPAGKYGWQELWDKTGFAKMAEEENVSLLPFENVQRVEFKDVGVIPILKELQDFDAVISVPKLKTHILAKITAAVKNTYGLIIGGAKSSLHGNFPSPEKMGTFVGELFEIFKPDFVIMDAILCMEKDGPADGDPVHLGAILAGRDAAAVDACACRAYNYQPGDIPTLMAVKKAGTGIVDLAAIEKQGDGWDLIDNANLKRSKSDFLHLFPGPLFKVATLVLSCKPEIIQDKCKKCAKCAEICPQKAISKDQNNRFKVKKSKCITCVCCIEACPFHAIEMLSPAIKTKRLLKRIF